MSGARPSNETARSAWLRSSARNSLIYEDLVEGVPDEVFNIRFRETELQDRNLNAALAQLCNVGPSRNRMLKTVDRMKSRNPSRWTLYPHVDSNDGVAIRIDLCELIRLGRSKTASASSAATVPT